MELYYVVSILDRDKRSRQEKIYTSLGLRPLSTMLGRGTAPRELLSVQGLSPTEKAVMTTVADREDTKKLIRQSKVALYIDIPGNGVSEDTCYHICYLGSGNAFSAAVYHLFYFVKQAQAFLIARNGLGVAVNAGLYLKLKDIAFFHKAVNACAHDRGLSKHLTLDLLRRAQKRSRNRKARVFNRHLILDPILILQKAGKVISAIKPQGVKDDTSCVCFSHIAEYSSVRLCVEIFIKINVHFCSPFLYLLVRFDPEKARIQDSV